MGTTVLSLRLDSDLLERIRMRAAQRGTTVRDYVLDTLTRDDFDQRFSASVEEAQELYGDAS
ncbi:ribbon-helix-helix protein, CopG family [Wenjunlia tyrosinilytica]|uniref:Ribbon-helix-helix protein CopG domain-containing protein n=1 Tax=Wenjunlia tyrosinilytica TaxID=1544741 RepID=A0A917ZNV6_9ACTN|nr:ribbon-helix-helix protein, CopG family [Wenjunlia tyrosinilytica]GGO86942.1 hypothetical protein GCM10012280_24260 [Wenjunlia tyrosinilytica]